MKDSTLKNSPADSCWRKNWMRPLDSLQPDALGDDDHGGPYRQSFLSLQEKTLKTLYETLGLRDKSPKGSVDEPIRPLVDLINRHTHFSTLSTCSGRLALFDLEGSEDHDIADTEEISRELSPKSGKGHGRWLFVTHGTAETSDVLARLSGSSESLLLFKFEPFLLHVAASSVVRGRQLLQIALRLGLRESGLVVTEKRVTVAIRSQSLSLTVPMTRSGPLAVGAEYINGLVKLANERQQRNWEQLDRFYREVQQGLFTEQKVVTEACCKIEVLQKIPDLNLWGHAAVSVPSSDEPDSSGLSSDLIVWAFGGYGRGPDQDSSLDSSKPKGSQRSSYVYCLQRKRGTWDSSWERCETNTDADAVEDWNGIEVRRCKIPVCQGVSGCFLSKFNVVILWGGRAGPNSPFGSIYLFDPRRRRFGAPIAVGGTPPPPRWGHTLTTISDDQLVLIGGCDVNGPVSPNNVHILCFLKSEEGISLQWQTSPIVLPPRFHHTTSFDKSNKIVTVFGGLDSVQPTACTKHDALRFSVNLQPSSGPISISTTPTHARFGAACCLLSEASVHFGGAGAVVPICCSKWEDDGGILDVEVRVDSDIAVNFGSMVHHQCLKVKEKEVLLVGGGVHSFAFGDSFAESYLVSVDIAGGTKILENDSDSAHAKPESIAAKKLAYKTKAEPGISRVLYVQGKDAKQVKTRLEDLNHLSQVFRMIKADDGTVALPITEKCWREYSRMKDESHSESWISSIVGHGEQEMPLKTSQFARKRRGK